MRNYARLAFAVVPNAAIKIHDMGTGIEQSTVSSPEGNFAFANLQATYRFTATARVFQAVVYDNVADATTAYNAIQDSVGSRQTTCPGRTAIRTSNNDAPASTPGEYAQFIYLRNNTAFQFDMSLNKMIRIKERWRFNFQADALNFFNRPFFPLANTSPTVTNFGQITSATGSRTMQLRGSLEW